MDLFLFLIQLFFGWIAAYLISTLVHELGHVICGLCHGWKLYMLVVGPMKIYRKKLDSPIRIGIEKNPILWFGVGGTLPPSKSEENIRTWAKILLAGPVASIILGIVAGIGLIFWRNIFMLLLCFTPIAMGVMCAVPMKIKTGILYNDGTRYKRLTRGGQEGLEEKALFQLVEISVFGGDAPVYPNDLLAPLIASKDIELNYYGFYYSYVNALRDHNAEEMKIQLDHMESIRDKVPKTIVKDCPINI